VDSGVVVVAMDARESHVDEQELHCRAERNMKFEESESEIQTINGHVNAAAAKRDQDIAQENSSVARMQQRRRVDASLNAV
jgi:hypothetical protein